MIDPTLVAHYWHAVAGEATPLPEFDEDPVEVFKLLLDGTETVEFVPGAFRQLPPLGTDVYPAIAVAENPAAEMAEWAAEIAGLLPFSSPTLNGYLLYLDTVPDLEGNLRVYSFINGAPAEDIASVDEALLWMTAVVRYGEKLSDLSEVGKVEESLTPAAEWPWSGAELFCKLRALPLPEAYRAWSLRTWPQYDAQSTMGVATDGPGAGRIAMLAAVETVMRSRALDTRLVKSSRMSPAQKVLIGHLRQLTKAVAGGRPPELVDVAASSDDERLVAQARDWLARFAAAEATADVDLAPPDVSETSALRSAVVLALSELSRNEHIEIEDGADDRLADELSLAAFEAHNPRHALKKLRVALIRSDHVAEVYADDLELESVFRRAMGG